MEIILVREEYSPMFTIGKVYIDDKFFAYSLEDTVRPKGVVIREQTAIPAGRYRISWEWSNRFQKYTPRLNGVKGWLGVLIHVGNWAKDTEGCILMGLKRYRDGIGESQKAMAWLYPVIRTKIAEGHAVWLTIK